MMEIKKREGEGGKCEGSVREGIVRGGKKGRSGVRVREGEVGGRGKRARGKIFHSELRDHFTCNRVE